MDTDGQRYTNGCHYKYTLLCIATLSIQYTLTFTFLGLNFRQTTVGDVYRHFVFLIFIIIQFFFHILSNLSYPIVCYIYWILYIIYRVRVYHMHVLYTILYIIS